MTAERWTKQGGTVALIECSNDGTVEITYEVLKSLLQQAGFHHVDAPTKDLSIKARMHPNTRQQLEETTEARRHAPQ